MGRHYRYYGMPSGVIEMAGPYLVLKDGSLLLTTLGELVLSADNPPSPECCCGGGCSCMCVGGPSGFFVQLTFSGTATVDGTHTLYGDDACSGSIPDLGLTGTSIFFECVGSSARVTVFDGTSSVTADFVDGVATIAGSFFGVTLFDITLEPCE